MAAPAPPEDTLRLRPLRRADFPLLVEWLARPHVARWWGPPKDLDALEAEYGPCLAGTDPTEMLIGEDADGHAVALLQIYRLCDNADYARAVGVADAMGVDLLIGEADRCGHGLGPQLITAAVALGWAHYPEVQRAMAGPSVHNSRSHRAFEKAGFIARGPVSVPGEEDDELIFVRERAPR